MQEEERRERSARTFLFEEETDALEPYKNIYIPEQSIYDEQPPIVHKTNPLLSHKTITVFGYSSSNLDNVLRRFKEHGDVKDISYGKNWMDIRYKVEKCMFKALKENGSILNGEMIGVVQKSRKEMTPLTHYEKEQMLIKREEGVFGKVLTYLFG